MRKFVHVVDFFNEYFGRAVCLLLLPMVFVVMYEVIARKFFSAPTVWGFELTVYIYGAHFMLGMAYTHLHDRHVRIDILSQKWPVKVRLWISIITFLLIFLPFLGTFSYAAVKYAAHSIAVREYSWSAWKPPLYPYKALMPVGLILLLMQGVANFIRDIFRLKGEEI